jgi:hypothetical protein
MEQAILNDQLLFPNDDLIFSIIGEAELLWKQTFSYLFDTNKDITVNWKYSVCGKEWYCFVCKKKKTVCCIQIQKRNAFSIGFPFGDKLEPAILQSKLPERFKTDFMNAKRFNTTRYIALSVKDSNDVENVKLLIDLKTKN